MASTVELTDLHKRAWIAFFVSHGLLTKRIDAILRKAGVVPMDVYDLLLTLEMAPEGRLRMSELATNVLLTRSGLTRLVDRLERQGLISRTACPNDRRAVHAQLTRKGLAERERAWPVYRAAIAEHFGAQMSEDEAAMLAEVLGRFMPSGPGCPG
jgi:DNA-binding MarR family transcriptional regulator